MEVHAHTHTARKKWTHYFWEFLMLFLAVFCGFFAEYQLEHKIERDRGKQFMQSMIEDMHSDTSEINIVIRICRRAVTHLDSATGILLSGNLTDININALYRLNLSYLRNTNVYLTDRTSSQLKNAGGMRLIRNKEVADKLLIYWRMYEILLDRTKTSEELKVKAREKSYSIFSHLYYSSETLGQAPIVLPNAKLMTNDPLILTEFSNRLSHISNSIQNIYIVYLLRQKKASEDLMELIRNKYHLSKGTPLEK